MGSFVFWTRTLVYVLIQTRTPFGVVFNRFLGVRERALQRNTISRVNTEQNTTARYSRRITVECTQGLLSNSSVEI